LVALNRLSNRPIGAKARATLDRELSSLILLIDANAPSAIRVAVDVPRERSARRPT